MLIDGAFATQAIDSSGEVVEIKGLDVSYMEAGYGVANYEHQAVAPGDEQKSDLDKPADTGSGQGREIVGKIVYVHKVLTEVDCEDERQRHYFKLVRGIPYLYGVVRLYDGAGHGGAQALAAQIRDHAANKEQVLVRFSIEGSTLARDPQDSTVIKRAIARKVALTLQPCNRTCVSGVLADPNAPAGFQKSEEAIGGSVAIECDPAVFPEPPRQPGLGVQALALLAVRRMLRKFEGAPSAMTGLDARGVEDLERVRKATEDVEVANAKMTPGDISRLIPEIRKVEVRRGQKYHPAGRYMLHQGRIVHLEDYHGILEKFAPEGAAGAPPTHVGAELHDRPDAVPQDAAQAPQEPQDEVREEVAAPPPRPAVFHYQRPGMLRPHVLEFGEHGAALDGSSLGQDEVQLLLDNARSGLATVRYKPGTGLAKAAGDELSADDALTHIRSLLGHDHPTTQALTRHIYTDPMTGLGNKHAYQEFRKQNRPGTYLSIDLNSFKNINDIHGHDAGDAAITAAGAAVRAAADKVGTVKTWRPGGDEFVLHAPTHEDAATFARHFTQHLDTIPPVGGTHRLSASIGFGHDFQTADQALMHAKAGKLDPVTGQLAHPVGRTPHLAHSLIPGSEGPINLHTEIPSKQHLVNPPKPVKNAA